jgi:hypothetical protein
MHAHFFGGGGQFLNVLTYSQLSIPTCPYFEGISFSNSCTP